MDLLRQLLPTTKSSSSLLMARIFNQQIVLLLALVILTTGIVASFLQRRASLIISSSVKQSSIANPSGLRDGDQQLNISHARRAKTDSVAQSKIDEGYGHIPLQFEANGGQAATQVKFLARGRGYGLFLTPNEAVLALHKPQANHHSSLLRMRLEGANQEPKVSGQDELPGKVNYLIGNDPAKWRTEIATFRKILYKDVYPGIDLLYYGNQQQLEYDFVVGPGSSPSNITLTFNALRKVRIDSDGDLVLSLNHGVVRQHKPVIYQEVDGSRKIVAGNYILKGDNRVGFAVEDYDQTKPLIIDPVLVYATYLGGTNSDESMAVAVDSGGNAYLTGYTYSSNFPITPGAFQEKLTAPNINSDKDAFVTKLNDAGNAVLYSTYLGGKHGTEEGRGIAVDTQGNAYVVGLTSAADFPTTSGAFQPTSGNAVNSFNVNDAFIAKLNATGNALIYSTFLGGNSKDEGYSIALDSDRNAYVTGTTDSSNFPITSGAPQTTRVGFQPDAFISKINGAGSALVYSTFLGGSNAEFGYAIATDVAGNAYVAGETYSDNFPVTSGVLQSAIGASGYGDGFIAKLNSAGTTFIYATYLGGNGYDGCRGIALDNQGQVYVAGYSQSSNFPVTPGAYQTSPKGSRFLNNDIIVAKLNSAGSQLLYSTYVGSDPVNSNEYANAIALNANGEVFVAGGTESQQFPTTPDAIQRTVNDTNSNVVVFKLNSTGSTLLYSTYLGGNDQEFARGLAIDSVGDVYVTGLTMSTNFPVTPGAFQTFPSGNHFDLGAFVAKIGAPRSSSLSVSGHITDSSGSSLAGIMVSLSGPSAGTQWTDANGNYSFGNLTSGENYTVTPASPYYDFAPQKQTFNNLSANQTADFVGTVRQFSISGHIADANGNNIQGVRVDLSGAQTAVTQTDSAGNYSFNNLPAVGSYTIAPSKDHYFFNPFQASFNNLSGNQTANFTGTLYYTISGRVVNKSNGDAVAARIEVRGTRNLNVQTDQDGYYTINLIPGNYTLTPVNFYYTFTPDARSFTDLSEDQTANFEATSLYGEINGRLTDENGNGLSSVTINLSGAVNLTTITNQTGNFGFSGLKKGTSYNITASKVGYTISPSSAAINVTNDETFVSFIARLNRLQPFTSGNFIVSCDQTLYEYTPDGRQVQAVIVPYPDTSLPIAHYMGDIVLDQSGEVEIYNGDTKPYLTSFDFIQSSWRNHTYSDWNTWGYHMQSGIASFDKYIYVTDKGLGEAPGTGGILRINLNDFSSQRFATSLEFFDVTLGLDGLLYALSNDKQIFVYQPESMQPVRTISLDSNVAFSVRGIAVNQSGDIFAGTYNGYFYHFDKNGAVIKKLYIGPIGEGVGDIEVSPSGQIIAGNDYGRVFQTDESLNALSSFPVGHGGSFVTFNNTVPLPTTYFKFSAENYNVAEGNGSASITVSRGGDVSKAAKVDYAVSDGTARQRTDYTLASGTLSFAPGENAKSFSILIEDNVYVDGARTVKIELSNAEGSPIVAPSSATLTISDNDSAAPTTNPIDSAQFFVRQHYYDFLNREPDQGGLDYWSSQITQCGSDINCINSQRIAVSAAYFIELEFQDTGSYVYRFYKASYGQRPTYAQFMPDRSRVVGGANLDEGKQAFADAWVNRPEFLAKYPASLSGPQFIDAIVQTVQQGSGVDLSGKKQALIDDYNANQSRSRIVRLIVDDAVFKAAEYNRAFVLMQYFGYLRRDPDEDGYLFWLDVLNNRVTNNYRGMVCAFLTSAEYQDRFSPVRTRNDSICSQ